METNDDDSNAGDLALSLPDHRFHRRPRVHAQLQPPNEMGVTMGHVHLIAHDVDGMRKFFVGLGGTSIEDGRLIEFPGIFIMVSEGEPTAGTAGSIVNHIGFKVKNIAEIAREVDGGRPVAGEGIRLLRAAGRTAYRDERGQDDQRIRSEFYHVHMWVDKPQEVQAWYQKMFGSVSSERPTGNLFMYVGDIPGANLTFSDVMRMGPPAGIYPPLAGTKGRALDHIGFEVKNLEAFCKKLEAQGDQVRSASAERDDPGRRNPTAGRLSHRSVGHVHRADREPRAEVGTTLKSVGSIADKQ